MLRLDVIQKVQVKERVFALHRLILLTLVRVHLCKARHGCAMSTTMLCFHSSPCEHHTYFIQPRNSGLVIAVSVQERERGYFRGSSEGA